MPFLTIYTNSDVKDDSIVVDAAQLVATQLSKPIRYVVVNIINNSNMAFDGAKENKGALLEMKSIGFGNKQLLAQSLTNLIAEKMQVNKNLVNIEFVDMPANTVAIGGNLLG